MRVRTLIAVLGYLLIALAVCGLMLTILTAIRDGQPFYGRNVYGLAIGTCSAAAIMIMGAAIGLAWLVRKVARHLSASNNRH